jgi:splicing factor 3A subunit 3
MQNLYFQYSNLKKLKRTNPIDDYLVYLEKFGDLEQVPVCSKDANYEPYVKNVGDYLKSFYQKSNPLKPVDEIYKEIDQDFEARFIEGDMPGWRSELK